MKKACFILSFFILYSCTAQNIQKKPISNTSVDTLLPVAPNPSSSATPNVPSPTPTPKPDNNERIAFMSNRDGFWDIYTMYTDGSNQTKLTNDNMRGPFAFSVSPDGKKLAYISDKSGNPDLWVLDLETKEITQLTKTPNYEEGSPTWSSDNATVAFHSNANGNGYEILKISYPLTSSLPKVQVLITDANNNLLHPSFSPDGNQVMYTSFDEKGQSTLYTYNSITKKTTQLTKKEDNVVNGSWSPDSKNIIYWTNASGIFQVNADGTGQYPIGTIKNAKGTPFYSPDGKKIILSRGYGYAEDYNVWVMDNDGRNPQKLTTLGGISLAWYKKFIKPVTIPSSSGYTPSPAYSGAPYIDPNDPVINP